MEQLRQGMGLMKRFRALGPTERTDGTPISIDEISHYVRTVEFNGATEEMTVELVEDASTPEYDGEFDELVDVDQLAPGVYVYSYQTVDLDGRMSAPSEAKTLEILPPIAAPNPPQSVSLVG